MRKFVLISSVLFLIVGCDGIRGWFPGVTDAKPSPPKAPTQGCNRDIVVQYTNNYSSDLIMYFMEVIPGNEFNCEELADQGKLLVGQSKTNTIHKGKIGLFVFSETIEGKCTSGKRKAEAWINGEQSTTNDISLNVISN